MKTRLLSIALSLIMLCMVTNAQSGLQLTEILYDIPSGADPNGDGTRQPAGDEFVELYNSSNATIDLTGYVIIEREGVVVFTFPVNTLLGAKKFAVVFGNAITPTWGTSFPAGTLKFSHYTGTTDQGFGPATTPTGSVKTNLASNGDRIMIVNPLLADTVAEVAYGYDVTLVTPVKLRWSKGTYIAGAKSVKGDTLQGQIRQSIHLQTATGKWGRHKDIAKDTTVNYSIGFLPDVATAVEQDAPVVPNSIVLKQNYPNPFNPSTTITFEIAGVQNVTLKVYDIAGKEVAKLLDKRLGGGVYFTNFDAKNLPSGSYVYTLKVGTHEVSKVMSLVK